MDLMTNKNDVMIKSKQYLEVNWQEVKETWTKWWNKELDRPMVVLERLEPGDGLKFPAGVNLPVFSDFDDSPLQFPLDMEVNKLLDHYQKRLEYTRYYGDAFPRFWPNFGPGIIAGFLGAKVEYAHENKTIWFDIGKKLPIKDFNPRFNPDNVYWQRVKEITSAAVERWGNKVQVAFTDLGGNLDILSAVVEDQELLTGMLLNPDDLRQVTDALTSTWLKYYNELYAIIKDQDLGTSPWAHIFSPGKSYMLQSDMAVMIDTSMFEQYVLPDLKTCCDNLEHAFYHLDGKEQLQHLDLLLSIENLHGIQWIPGAGNPPPEEWMDVLKKIRDAGKLCQLYVSPGGAMKIKNELGAKGFAFYIWSETSDSEASELIEYLYKP